MQLRLHAQVVAKAMNMKDLLGALLCSFINLITCLARWSVLISYFVKINYPQKMQLIFQCNLKSRKYSEQRLNTCRQTGVLPRLYTWGTCDTCNAAGSDRGRTTEFSAGPPCTPAEREHSRGPTVRQLRKKECVNVERKRQKTSSVRRVKIAKHRPLLEEFRQYSRVSSDLWRFVRRLAGLHGLLVVGLPTETHLEGWRFPVLLQLSDHRDLREVVQGRLDTREKQRAQQPPWAKRKHSFWEGAWK